MKNQTFNLFNKMNKILHYQVKKYLQEVIMIYQNLIYAMN